MLIVCIYQVTDCNRESLQSRCSANTIRTLYSDPSHSRRLFSSLLSHFINSIHIPRGVGYQKAFWSQKSARRTVLKELLHIPWQLLWMGFCNADHQWKYIRSAPPILEQINKFTVPLSERLRLPPSPDRYTRSAGITKEKFIKLGLPCVTGEKWATSPARQRISQHEPPARTHLFLGTDPRSSPGAAGRARGERGRRGHGARAGPRTARRCPRELPRLLRSPQSTRERRGAARTARAQSCRAAPCPPSAARCSAGAKLNLERKPGAIARPNSEFEETRGRHRRLQRSAKRESEGWMAPRRAAPALRPFPAPQLPAKFGRSGPSALRSQLRDASRARGKQKCVGGSPPPETYVWSAGVCSASCGTCCRRPLLPRPRYGAERGGTAEGGDRSTDGAHRGAAAASKRVRPWRSGERGRARVEKGRGTGRARTRRRERRRERREGGRSEGGREEEEEGRKEGEREGGKSRLLALSLPLSPALCRCRAASAPRAALRSDWRAAGGGGEGGGEGGAFRDGGGRNEGVCPSALTGSGCSRRRVRVRFVSSLRAREASDVPALSRLWAVTFRRGNDGRNSVAAAQPSRGVRRAGCFASRSAARRKGRCFLLPRSSGPALRRPAGYEAGRRELSSPPSRGSTTGLESRRRLAGVGTAEGSATGGQGGLRLSTGCGAAASAVRGAPTAVSPGGRSAPWPARSPRVPAVEPRGAKRWVPPVVVRFLSFGWRMEIKQLPTWSSICFALLNSGSKNQRLILLSLIRCPDYVFRTNFPLATLL